MGRRISVSGARDHRRRSKKSGGGEGPRRGSPTWVLLAAAALVVAGCSGGDDPPPPTKSGPVTSQTTTATTSTAAPNDIPVAARAHTPAGAVAFVRYFIEQSNEAWTQPEAGLLPRLSDRDCIACKALEDTAVELVARHQRYVGDPVTIQSLRPVPGTNRDAQLVKLAARQNRVNVVDAAGSVVRTDGQRILDRTVAVHWEEEGWVLFDAD